MKLPAVFAVETSRNAKLGSCSATYVSQESCPRGCPFRGAGCYAEEGRVGLITRRLNRGGRRTPAGLARAEAEAIGRLTADRPLRLHVVGDCATPLAARIVADAARRYRARRGSPVWTYTHAWRAVPRDCWGQVSVLASCESASQVAEARRAGYATALVVPEFPSDRAFTVAGERVIPCPHQTRGVTCRDCRLCWDDGRLWQCGLSIGFAAHGTGAAKVRLALPLAGG
jgi:hypothetical protein